MSEQLALLGAHCRSCARQIIWAVVAESGRRIPLDPEEVQPAVRTIALNPESGRCRVMTLNDMLSVDAWRRAGVTWHRAHFATCPHADRWRVDTGEPA